MRNAQTHKTEAAETNQDVGGGAKEQKKAPGQKEPKSRFISVEKLGICSPIGQKWPLDSPELDILQQLEMDAAIVPIFDSEADNGKALTKKAINKMIGKANAQWYLSKKQKDPIVDQVIKLGDYRRPQGTSSVPRQHEGKRATANDFNLFDSKRRQARTHKKCTSMAHPSKTTLLNKFNMHNPDYTKILTLRRLSSIHRTTQEAMTKIRNKEILHQ